MSAARRVVIVGLGLIGGSLAQALKRGRRAPHITATTLESDAAERALADGVVDAVIDDRSVSDVDADIVVYATPVDATLALLEGHAPFLRGGRAAVTDVGSVKVPAVTCARTLGIRRFVGSHPLCGAETSGYAAARADLFDGACVFVVASEDAAADESVARMWRAAGARVEPMDADVHDERMAWVSHLPQIIASSLGATFADAGISPALLGPGGRDMVRMAASPPDMWTEILCANRQRIALALRAFSNELNRLEAALAAGDAALVGELLGHGRAWRREGEG